VLSIKRNCLFFIGASFLRMDNTSTVNNPPIKTKPQGKSIQKYWVKNAFRCLSKARA